MKQTIDSNNLFSSSFSLEPEKILVNSSFLMKENLLDKGNNLDSK